MRFRHGDVIGEIDNLPGCSQIAVFHSVFVPPNMRGHGLGRIAHAERLVEAEHLGYDVTMCTTDSSNEAQTKILKENNWSLVHTFKSSKTGHTVNLWVKDLT
jgi:predicted GNAT family acetyltransferase